MWTYIILAVVLASGFLLANPIQLWIQSLVSGAKVGFVDLLLMPLRKVQPRVIVKCKVMAIQSGLSPLSTMELEAHVLAGGDVERVTLALIAANRAGIVLDWNTAAAIDLSGRDILDAVRVSVNPKVIHCPELKSSGNADILYGVAKDGIQLEVKVLVTVRTNLVNLVGGATEPTVVARVGQSIISAIGNCESFRDALCDPTIITKNVLAKGLDSQTIFSILSIDIADIDVGKNIGAQLQVDQADADMRVARADAENRRAMAVANQQEMTALVTKSRAHFILAESKVPQAMANAFINGRMGLKNDKIHAKSASVATDYIPFNRGYFKKSKRLYE